MAKLNFDSTFKKIKSTDFDFDPVMVILNTMGAGTLFLLGLWVYNIPFVYNMLHEKNQLDDKIPQAVVEEFTENPLVVLDNNTEKITVIDLDSVRPKQEDSIISKR